MFRSTLRTCSAESAEPFCTVFKLNVSAILASARRGFEWDLLIRKILILSDSKATILVVKGFQLNPNLALEVRMLSTNLYRETP